MKICESAGLIDPFIEPTSKPLFRWLVAVTLVLALYFGSYICLSALGRYEPDIVGAAGPKSYAWAPLGFYSRAGPWPGSVAAGRNGSRSLGGWNRSLVVFYFPLYNLDRQAFHKP
jgi:hypothetical protein